jgi:hypothetical protein
MQDAKKRPNALQRNVFQPLHYGFFDISPSAAGLDPTGCL